MMAPRGTHLRPPPPARRAERDERRLERQFEFISVWIPASRGLIQSLLHGRSAKWRIPVGVLLILGGLGGALPLLGTWMLPLGLLVLAVDVPLLRPVISSAFIRTRRRARVLLRWLRHKFT